MEDIPDDLTDVGTHGGNQPPTETGQTVRAPTGPDPSAEEAQPVSALFQVIRDSSPQRLTVQTYSARTELSEPEEGKQIGQYRTVESLRDALAQAGIDGWTAVFEEKDGDRFILSPDVTADHSWIGQPAYQRVTFFADEEDAHSYVEVREGSGTTR